MGMPGIKVLIPPIKLFEFEIENLYAVTGSYYPEKWPGTVPIPTERETKEQKESPSLFIK